MALWQLDIEKVLLGEYWTNRYIIDGPNMADALISANIVYEAERDITKSVVTFTKYRVSDGLPNTDVYQIVNLNTVGTVAPDGNMLPLFNVVRVDFNTTGGGRPSRKYLRLPLYTTEVGAGGALAAGILGGVGTEYADVLAGLTAYVDVDGQQIVSGSVWPFVGMRQLRRGSKRREEEIIPSP